MGGAAPTRLPLQTPSHPNTHKERTRGPYDTSLLLHRLGPCRGRGQSPWRAPQAGPPRPLHTHCLAARGTAAATHPPEVPAGGRGPPLAPSRPSSCPPADEAPVHLQREEPGWDQAPGSPRFFPPSLPTPGSSLENGSGKRSGSEGSVPGASDRRPEPKPRPSGSLPVAVPPHLPLQGLPRAPGAHQGRRGKGMGSAAQQAPLYKRPGRGGRRPPPPSTLHPRPPPPSTLESGAVKPNISSATARGLRAPVTLLAARS